MCTVSFFKLNDTDFVLTSNRDEAPNRESLAPENYIVNNVSVLFPKDKLVGGTWIGTSQKNRTLCVLNGGFVAHERRTNYRLSRGIIVRDLLVTGNILEAIETYNLNDVEPFTLVIVLHDASIKLFELVWDGQQKHVKPLPLEPRVWSSSSLFTAQMKQERQQWFTDFIKNYPINPKTIMKFHTSAGKDNLDFGVIMDRHFVKTTSITQVIKEQNVITMTYRDIDDLQVIHQKSLKPAQSVE